MNKNYILGFERVNYLNKEGKEINGYKIYYTYKSKKDTVKGVISDSIYISNNEYNQKLIEDLERIDNFPIEGTLFIRRSKYEEGKFYLSGYNLND